MKAFIRVANKYDPECAIDDFAWLVHWGRDILCCSQYELGQELNTGAGTISRWENNHSKPPAVGRIGIIKRLASLIEFAEKFN